MTPALERAYANPSRRYHSRRHIDDCLTKLDAWPGLTPDERRVLGWAIWWHDAIYDARASDNEARSADLARADLPALGATPAEVDEVARLILLTAGHQVPDGDRLGAVLVSIDLSILASEPAAYDAYARAVREEYAHVPDELWRPGRARVLQHFLDAPVIFADPAFRAAHEAQARANLAREIASLR
ncbi:MAG: phosphohydrolase [Alphaproteobacteria bacterium]|nr:phosphohydrolase [Alphaproteobacteria bacterium]MBU1516443.1 phosphohydrolase [Alphaproteobacteria bacterium]MBU2094200.1 phosphohydrolase [Alphaproteobacteria bacterium]MBU2150498.1 phosphohydrolase [Alphaproteobacteria bacterium]MBU2307370.1 phosphohydrolase [Alphaproteobacteria bacterium]